LARAESLSRRFDVVWVVAVHHERARLYERDLIRARARGLFVRSFAST
jgi:hypothetical protein